MAENLDLQSLTALRAGIMVGGELAWHRREKEAGGVLDAGSNGRRSSAAAAIG